MALAMTSTDHHLPGEVIVAQAHKVHHLLGYIIDHDQTRGGSVDNVIGTLVCTNYCFTFEPDTTQKLGALELSRLASSYRVPLGCVRELYMVASGRKRPVEGHSTLPRKISVIEIICTDLRRLVFSVKQCAKNEAISILNALARHTQPSAVSLLFGFDYARATKHKKPNTNKITDSPSLFLCVNDWQREMTRLNVASDQWRISDANKEFLICDSLCPFIVVPSSARDNTLDYVASLHHGNRLPVWCWSHPNTGVSLTRGSAPSIDDQSEAPDPNYMYAISMARNIDHQIENKRTATIDITKTCGTIWDLRTAFNHIKDFSLPESSQELAGQDKKWLGGMDNAGWLLMVRNCLRLAKTAVETICIQHRSVFLQEESDRDMSCIVSSLAQLMMDPHFRSISGFQSLIQKEWIAMGHPFTSRHHLTSKITRLSPDGTTEEAPVEAPTFLLFLDCVRQLSIQFPSAFEFSEFYLLELHNLSYSCLYGTFIFNSPKACLQAAMISRHSHFFGEGIDEGLSGETPNAYEGLLTTAWGTWRDQLTKDEREHCLNPLYYVFGSSEARYDYTTSEPLPMYNQFSTIFDNTTPNLVVGGSYGLYSKDFPMRDLHVSPRIDKTRHYQLGLLLPETSSCTIRPWLGFFTRYIPEFEGGLLERRRISERVTRLVKDVRNLKDTLNELELSVGMTTSDLTSFIGAILAAREKEKQNRMSSLSPPKLDPVTRPRLSATIEGDHKEESKMSHIEVPQTSKTLPTHVKSLAEFTETLYRYSDETTPTHLGKPEGLMAARASSPSLGSSSPASSGRSPITKTRLRVTRSSEPSSLHPRWGGTTGSNAGHVPLLPNKILIREQNMSLEEEEVAVTEDSNIIEDDSNIEDELTQDNKTIAVSDV